MRKKLLGALLVVLSIVPFAAAGDDPGVKFTSPKDTVKTLPKDTVKTLLAFLKNGRVERVPECFVAPRTEDERNMLLYGLGDDAYLPAVHKALVARFGESASPLADKLLGFDQQLEVIDSMEETTDGVNGRLAIKGQDKGGILFLKVKNDWKLAIAPGAMLRPVPRDRLAAAQALRAAYLDTVKEIEKGKFASADEALKTLEARRQAAVQPR